VLLLVQLLHFKIRFEKHAVAILIWRGLRDGLSVALALSLSATMHRDEFVFDYLYDRRFLYSGAGVTIETFTQKLLRA
jgi:CPA1 family monovalent cation:H+ antiporter